MAFTHAWDTSLPPDTQLAKLLGQNIRDLKMDVQERMRQFASGTIAARPTPEAGFGDANNGLIYFATDEGKWYTWNGTGWNLEFCSTSFSDLTRSSILDPGTGIMSNQIGIPANFLVPGMSLYLQGSVYVDGTIGSSTPSISLQMFINGAWEFLAIAQAPAAGSGGAFNTLCTVLVNDLTTLVISSQAYVTGGLIAPSNLLFQTVNMGVIIYFRTVSGTIGASSGCHFTGFGLTAKIIL